MHPSSALAAAQPSTAGRDLSLAEVVEFPSPEAAAAHLCLMVVAVAARPSQGAPVARLCLGAVAARLWQEVAVERPSQEAAAVRPSLVEVVARPLQEAAAGRLCSEEVAAHSCRLLVAMRFYPCSAAEGSCRCFAAVDSSSLWICSTILAGEPARQDFRCILLSGRQKRRHCMRSCGRCRRTLRQPSVGYVRVPNRDNYLVECGSHVESSVLRFHRVALSRDDRRSLQREYPNGSSMADVSTDGCVSDHRSSVLSRRPNDRCLRR